MSGRSDYRASRDPSVYLLGFSWVTASVAGAVSGFWFLTFLVQRFLPFGILFSLPGIILVRGAVVGAFLGLFQRRILYRLHAEVDRWILRTTAAYVGGASLIAAVQPMLRLMPLTTTGRYVLEVPLLLAGGIVMGAIQSSGLRQTEVDRRTWVWAMGLGWTLGSVLPFAVPGLGPMAYFPNAATHGLWGIGVGLVTLYPLRTLLRDG